MPAPNTSDHYTGGRAAAYASHHEKNLRTRITTARERSVLRSFWKLAGSPETVLDLPCGTGRFWPAFDGTRVRRIIGADSSSGMLEQAEAHRPPGIDLSLLNTSVFDIDLADGAVPFCACLRFFHHLGLAGDRRRALDELARVTRGHVVVSLWTDGNLGAFRRRHKQPPVTPGYGKRRVIPAHQIEAEFIDAGYRILTQRRIWPRLAMWHCYLLQTPSHDS